MASRIRPTNRRRGFTVYEALLASVVLAYATIAVSGSLTASDSMSQTMQQTVTATALANELLEEISAFPLANPSTGTTTPAATATPGARSGFAYIGAFNGYSDSGSSLPELNGNRINISNGLAYSRSVTVATGALPSVDNDSPSTDFALVTVKVTTPLGFTVSLQRVMTNYALNR